MVLFLTPSTTWACGGGVGSNGLLIGIGIALLFISIHILGRIKKWKTFGSLFLLLGILLIISLLISISLKCLNPDEGKVRAVSVQIEMMKKALADYRLDCGAFPSSDQGLNELVSSLHLGKQCLKYNPNGYMAKESFLRDPWGNRYLYESLDRKSYTIKSYGSDGVEGGTGFGSDIAATGP